MPDSSTNLAESLHWQVMTVSVVHLLVRVLLRRLESLLLAGISVLVLKLLQLGNSG